METTKAYTLHEEHTIWLNKILFYIDDIRILENRLGEVVAKNTNKDILAMADHFQNQFIMRKEQMDELRHSIKEHEAYLKNKLENNNSAHHVSLGDHAKERETMESFEKAFAEMRHEFISFLSKVF